MRWAALYRHPPILRGVSASQIRADHAANQARINARYGPALPSSPRSGVRDRRVHLVVALSRQIEQHAVFLASDESAWVTGDCFASRRRILGRLRNSLTTESCLI